LISDYCQLYSPLRDDLAKDIIDFWVVKREILDNKKINSVVKTPNERFLEILIDHSASNDIKYYDKNCDDLEL